MKIRVLQCFTLERKFESELPKIHMSNWTLFLRNTCFRSSPSASSIFYPILPYKPYHSLLNNVFRKLKTCLLTYKRPPMSCNYNQFSTVFDLFDKMPQRDPHLQGTCFSCVVHLLKSASRNPRTMTAMTIHCLALKIGALAHLPIVTSLLTTYSRAENFASSWDLFHEIYGKDVIVWNAMITASVENCCFQVAINIFVQMIEEGSRFDSTTLIMVVSALSHINYFKQGKAIHSFSLKVGMLLDSSLCNALINMNAKIGDLESSESMFSGMECRDIVSWNSMMRACLYSNQPEKCLWYFSAMASFEERADKVSLSCAISASRCLGDLYSGQAIHGLGIKLGYEDKSAVSVANSLISLYSHCGDIVAAETVFRQLVYKDVISWNAMIDGFASNGEIMKAFDLLQEMQVTGSAQPDKVTLITIIGLCNELMLSREGRTVHAYAIRRHMVYDPALTNSLMDMHSKCDSVMQAEFLFDMMQEKDLVSWNTMILGYSKNGYCKEAQMLFRELLRWGLCFSLSTLLAILPSCESPGYLQFGKSIHCWQMKLGFSTSSLAVNSLMHMYINCGDFKTAFSWLRRISAAADIACWNTVIVGCTQNGHFREALEAFKLMQEDQKVGPDSITLVSVISACGNLELAFEGKYLHGLALKTFSASDIRVQNALITMYSRCGIINNARFMFNLSSNRNLCSWNCMISALAQNKDGTSALQLFRLLEFEPNEITIVAALSACTQLGFLRYGKQIHGHALRFGLEKNSFINAALVSMYSNCGRLDTSLQVFRNSEEKCVAAWNSIISAYGNHGYGRKAIEIFKEMCENGTRPTKSTFTSLLSACSHSGLVKDGLWYYSQMLKEFGVEPVSEHQVCVVSMLGRSGKLGEAYEFIKGMQNWPEPGVFGAVLSGCNYHGDIKMGRQVAEILFEMEPENVGYYISLSNMYVGAGGWKDAVELRGMIQQRKLQKPAGYSLIDVGFV